MGGSRWAEGEGRKVGGGGLHVHHESIRENLGGGGATGRGKDVTVRSYPSSHLRLDLRDEDDDDPE